jgi:hypothetical protein
MDREPFFLYIKQKLDQNLAFFSTRYITPIYA